MVGFANYEELSRALLALTRDVPYETANLANAAALLWQAMEDINWVGFYKMEDGALILGPFQGKPACVRIAPGKGVCGTAARLGKVQRVANVHAFPGHIACDGASNAEIVLPLYVGGRLWGVLDIDSPVFGRFTQEDEAGLGAVAAVLERVLGDCVEAKHLPIDKVGK